MIQESASNVGNIRRTLQDFELRGLFVEELGWEPHSDRRYIEVEGTHHELNAVAHKRGMVVYTHVTGAGDEMPDSATRRKVERQLAKHVLEHFIVYANADKTSQVWQWVKREPGSPAVTRELRFDGRPTESLVQRLQRIAFTLEEEDRIGLPDVWGRVQASFDVERVTRRFYDLFKKEHDAFLGFIQGLEDAEDCQWYASIMLNRLMFVYFVQRKGFLDGNQNYLRDKLRQMQSDAVEGNFLTFYRRFLLRLFHEGLGKDEDHRASEVDAIIGRVPYLNGGLFDVHELEESNPDLDIPDEAFERIFDFFDGYRWHLDERPLREDNEINPDVLGYIFEKYINQRQMGAYYTQEDVTGYITQNAVIPYLFDAARKGCAVAFEPDSAMWSLLSENPDRYIYEAVLKGVDEPLPEEIAAGVDNVSRRGRWNQRADEQYALPTETWREHVARRQRCEELRSKLSAGEIHEINDLVTLNLNIRQFAQDTIESAEGPELVRAFYGALKDLSVLDPTCGSGAFLFAALNVLEPLYEACLERMQRFVDEDASGERYTDFRRVLSEMGHHLSQRYFILKSIMVNNLYGVDIMEEAVEIARLRLFLKLMAQVEYESQIEPLPDLDFNLRVGNTLVGFATLEEVQEALTSKLDFENSQERIQAKASDADDAFQIFRWMQIEEPVDSEELREAKADVREKLGELNDELDRYLASAYGVDSTDAQAFETWRESHQPFHWYVQFNSIVRCGGFDVIIGNPPYVEYKDVKEHYTVRGFHTEPCGDLYAFVVERCYALTSTAQRIGLIVPISIFNTDGFVSLQRLSVKKLGVAWISSFANRPAQLFEGAQKRLTTLLGKRESALGLLHRTSYLRWKKEERPVLFAARVEYGLPEESFRLFPASLEKLGSDLEASAFSKLLSGHRKLEGAIVGSKRYSVYYTRKFGYFLAFLDFVPEIQDLKTGERKLPTELKILTLDSSASLYAVLAGLSSTTFFWFWNVLSDCRNLNRRDLLAFPFNPLSMPSGLVTELESLGKRYIERLRDTSRFMIKSGSKIQTFDYSSCKQVLDEIDSLLANYYGFTDEELDFIINYDIKYRMGTEQA